MKPSIPFDRLTANQKRTIQEHMEGKAFEPNELLARDLVRYWLHHNGIIGYTDDVIDLVLRAYGHQVFLPG